MKRREHLKLLGAVPFLPAWDLSALPFHEPVEHRKALSEELYDLVVYGGTPGGVACAVRAAREGLTVLLVNHNDHLGGMFVNGLGTMDTLYNGARAPIYDAFRYSIYDHYRLRYGYNSAQYQATQPGFPKTRFESHVAERLISEMVSREPNIKVLLNHYPSSSSRRYRSLESVTFVHKESDNQAVVQASVFADCSYEGDLLAVAGAPFRLGREGSAEYGEQHAGIAYMQKDFWPPPVSIDHELLQQAGKLNLYRYDSWSGKIMPQSTGAPDAAIQAFNFRSTLTNDPDNRIVPAKPVTYDRDYLARLYAEGGDPGLGVPNMKTSWNHPELVGLQNDYIQGDWPERARITQRFREVTLGLLHFRQNDPSVPEEERRRWREYGLSGNEYPDNGNVPYEIYVREGRRVVGHGVFTEHDAQLAPGLDRAPVHTDSISITEWFMDSHACTDQRIEGSKLEGEVMLKNQTFPGQVPFRTIFSSELDNLMVPVCLSASHIGWGTIRLEPTWMSIGEAAGYAASMAARKQVAPAQIESDALVRLLAKKGVMISFFNDVEGREYAPWYPAVQYLGTKGFFATYEARPDELLGVQLMDVWIAMAAVLVQKGEYNVAEWAQKVLKAEEGGKQADGQEFIHRLEIVAQGSGFVQGQIRSIVHQMDIHAGGKITRGDACRILFAVIESAGE
jgi:hypothetical protein